MTTTFTAQVAQIFELQSFETKDGTRFTKRRILLQTVEQYPQRMLITVCNDLANHFPHHVGETITAYISFDAQPNKDGNNYYNDIRCWRID
ncbi:MAG: DUF3127 domain-containing protein [Paludibacteraceae bacterium]|nr:DUF3127 domain-containing protein [Paludibacteraceae bacterium]